MSDTRGLRRLRGLASAASVSMLIGLVGCGDDKPKSATTTTTVAPEDVAPTEAPPFDAKTFTDPTTIDNEWFPNATGYQVTYEGQVKSAEENFRRRIVFTVTDLTKDINGIKTRVLWERDYNDDVLAESEILFLAQDDAGAVWLLGEYPEEYEEGKFTGAPSTWVAGLEGAEAGIVMLPDPTLDSPTYVQGLAPKVEFYDVARISKVGLDKCVPAGCYKDVIVIDEWDPAAQPEDGHQLKYQAKGVGNLGVEAKGGTDQETLELTKVETISPEALEEARVESLKLDDRAYTVNEGWKTTARVQRTG